MQAPAPEPPPLPQTELEKLSAEARALGYEFKTPADMKPEDLEDMEGFLEEFLGWARDDFEEALYMMEVDEIIREDARPTPEQLHAIGNELLASVINGGSCGNEMDVRAVILKFAPSLRT